MAKLTKFQRVYAVLRAQRPFDSEHDLLHLAHYFIKAHREPELLLEFEAGYRRPPFSAMPVDQAFEDGGWRVLEFERRAGFFRED
jgi:hypothetical protein